MIDVYKQHKGKKVYKISAVKTLKLDQYIIADNEDEAFDKWLENGGIKHDKINSGLTNTDIDVDTDYIDVSTGEKPYHSQSSLSLQLGSLDVCTMDMSTRSRVTEY